jgi:transcriptional regulator with XRE-family HTH domain
VNPHPPADIDPAASIEACYGASLRRLRKAAGLSLNDLAGQVHYTGALVGLVETAQRAPTWPFTQAVDPAVGAGGLLIDLWHVIHQTGIAEWFRDFAELEAMATAMSIYEPQVVTGLLQTGAYAWAASLADKPHYTDDDRERAMANRKARQCVLDADRLRTLWVIQDEATLRRPVGGALVMREQLEKLLVMAGHPKVVLQVLPFRAGGHAGMTGPFSVLEIPGEDPLVWAEARGSGRLIHEPDEVAENRHAMDRLRASALSESDSFRLIETILKEYSNDPDRPEGR